MNFIKWMPWKYIIGWIARSYGFMDPAMILARIRSFSQPSEVQEPIELLRESFIFQARGLINTRVFQYNMDWLWPYWVEKQYNPLDYSFIPRAHSFSHINMTQRNWTAAGMPDLPLYPLVDPAGLVTPLYNGWSLDFCITGKDGRNLYPSRSEEITQSLLTEKGLSVRTVSGSEELRIKTFVRMSIEDETPSLNIDCAAISSEEAKLVVSVRPYNPEGISFIDTISYDSDSDTFLVNDKTTIHFNSPPEKTAFSNYEHGDVINRLDKEENLPGSSCRVGLCTGAAVFPMEAGKNLSVGIAVNLEKELHDNFPEIRALSREWKEVLDSSAQLKTPDSRLNYLYESSIRTLIQLTAGSDIYPGPFNYRRFWFRDACIMLNSLMSTGLMERSYRHINSFPGRQKSSGFFQSQDGEWDSNGQVLWILGRFLKLSEEKIHKSWIESAVAAVKWLNRKRNGNRVKEAYRGLLPSGFSAEHLGPNDYYYWDNFWALAGLKEASEFLENEDEQGYRLARETAEEFKEAVNKSLFLATEKTWNSAFPAAPYRRMDAGAVGSLVADYPLRLFSPGHHQIMSTCEWLMKNCFYEKGFFQDMIHSGINCYLSLTVAQVLLRAGDMRFRDIVEYMSETASPTGNWPEAVHPFSGGGCMGDGQHGWAAAEWIMMMRSLFIREEEGLLIIGSGLFPEWLDEEGEFFFGPTPTPFGSIKVEFKIDEKNIFITLISDCTCRCSAEVRIPGRQHINIYETCRAYRIANSPA